MSDFYLAAAVVLFIGLPLNGIMLAFYFVGISSRVVTDLARLMLFALVIWAMYWLQNYRDQRDPILLPLDASRVALGLACVIPFAIARWGMNTTALDTLLERPILEIVTSTTMNVMGVLAMVALMHMMVLRAQDAFSPRTAPISLFGSTYLMIAMGVIVLAGLIVMVVNGGLHESGALLFMAPVMMLVWRLVRPSGSLPYWCWLAPTIVVVLSEVDILRAIMQPLGALAQILNGGVMIGVLAMVVLELHQRGRVSVAVGFAVGWGLLKSVFPAVFWVV